MPTQTLVDIPFPFKGYNEVAANRRQPEGTTPGCLNVRPFDAIANRLRGGQRAGLSKYIAAAVNGTNKVQRIDQVVTALDPYFLTPNETVKSDGFSYSNGRLETVSSAVWKDYQGGAVGTSSYDIFNQDADDGDPTKTLVVSSGVLTPYAHAGATGEQVAGLLNIDMSAVASTYTISFDAVMETGASAFGDEVRLWVVLRVDNDPVTNHQYFAVMFEADNSDSKLLLSMWKCTANGAGSQVGSTVTLETGSGPFSFNVSVQVNGDVCSVYYNSVLKLQETMDAYSSQKRVAIGMTNDYNDKTVQIDNFLLSTASNITFRETHLIAVSGGSVYLGNPTDGLTVATGGTDVMSGEGDVATQQAYQKLYLVDGFADHYKVLDPSTRAVTTWEATSGVLPVGGVSTTYSITGVNTGTKTFTVAEDLSSLSDGDYISVSGSTGNDSAYTVASTTGSGPTNIVVDQSIPDATVDGLITLPGAACKYIALYRGRIVLWGLHTDPQNWFMSAVGDPLDWDYAPATTSETQAVAGNNSDAGLLGDVLLCCAPFSDDLMVMGGDHTLWVMRGDPAAGGVIDNISYQTGISGPYAYAWGPDGMFYFLGAGELWKMDGALAPQSMSDGRLSDAIDIDFRAYWAKLSWDRQRDALHIFLVPLVQASSGSQPVHVVWDSRTDSFWLDQFPATAGPLSVHNYDADDPDDRAFLLGGYDSYIRQFSDAAKDDDGTVINSYVDFTPLVVADAANMKITNIRAILDNASDAVRLEVYAEEDVQTLNASTTPRFTKTLAAGRNQPIIQRAVGNALNIRLENDAATAKQWALESLSAMLAQGGRQRHGVL